MTDDRSLERTARSWIEAGPTRAPEHAIEAALMTIETTPQVRDLRILRRFSTMTMTTRLAAAAVVGVLAIGATAFFLRPTAPDAGTTPRASASLIATPSTAPSDALAQLQAYRAAVGAVCNSLPSIPDPAPSPISSAVVAFLQATIARQNQEAAGLEAIQPPAALTTEHLANIQTVKDVSALLNHEIELIQANKLPEAAAVDEATGSLNTLREQFANRYALPACP
jgi:hypothetical protein